MARNRTRRLTGNVAAISVLMALSGCTTPFETDISFYLPGLFHETPKAQPDALQAEPNAAELATWWTQFNDPLLSTLVSEALENNTDLQTALARVDQARAAELGAFSMLMPTVATGGQIRRYEGGDTNSFVADRTGVQEKVVNYWQINLQAAWEIDLSGAGRARLAATREQIAATRADAQAVRLSLVSAVVSLYVNYRGAQQQHALSQKGLREAEEILDIVKRSFAAGVGMSGDINAAQASVAQAQTRLQQSDVAMAKLRLNLENICMMEPGALEEKLAANPELPHIPATLSAGQPIDLLTRRPDLIAAQSRFMAALSEGDAARLDYWPKLTLAGVFGQSGFGFGGGIPSGDPMWMGGANLVLPLFDFGAREAQVELSDARSKAALLAYKKEALGALFDVERALAQLSRDEELLTALRKQVSERTIVLQKTRRQYDVGDVGRFEIARDRVILLESESALINQQVAQLQTQNALFLAMGGGWDVRDLSAASNNEQAKE